MRYREHVRYSILFIFFCFVFLFFLVFFVLFLNLYLPIYTIYSNFFREGWISTLHLLLGFEEKFCTYGEKGRDAKCNRFVLHLGLETPTQCKHCAHTQIVRIQEHVRIQYIDQKNYMNLNHLSNIFLFQLLNFLSWGLNFNIALTEAVE